MRGRFRAALPVVRVMLGGCIQFSNLDSAAKINQAVTG